MPDIEGPMPGEPLGNRPRALRFKPGIKLDWSCKNDESMSEESVAQPVPPPNQKAIAYVHSSHITFISFPDLLHHLFFGSSTGFDGALDCNGPLRVVQS